MDPADAYSEDPFGSDHESIQNEEEQVNVKYDSLLYFFGMSLKEHICDRCQFRGDMSCQNWTPTTILGELPLPNAPRTTISGRPFPPDEVCHTLEEFGWSPELYIVESTFNRQFVYTGVGYLLFTPGYGCIIKYIGKDGGICKIPDV